MNPSTEQISPEIPATDTLSTTARFKKFREQHHVAFEILFFFAGFLFDVGLLHRIDSTPLLIHQGTYLVLTALLIFADHKIAYQKEEPKGILGKLASYRLWLMHFFLGTLLNAFLVFYFRASSGFFAMVFIVALSGVIVLNELPRFRKQGPVVRVALLSFSITSYLAYLLPVLWGERSAFQYFVAVFLGSLFTFGLWKLFQRLVDDSQWTFRRAVIPGLVVQVVLVLMYLSNAIPPVPLSLKHIGLYHDVIADKSSGKIQYTLSYEPAAKVAFWRTQSKTFHAVLGEKAWAFVRVFAPTKFQDTVSFAWEYEDDSKGWMDWGKPFSTKLSGGNEEGFRTFAFTTIRHPGKYRVHVLTADGREIGRDTFEVELIEDVTSRTLVESGEQL